MNRLPILVFFVAVFVQILPLACYDPKSPKLPPCADEPWPNPCAGMHEPKDAGR